MPAGTQLVCAGEASVQLWVTPDTLQLCTWWGEDKPGEAGLADSSVATGGGGWGGWGGWGRWPGGPMPVGYRDGASGE